MVTRRMHSTPWGVYPTGSRTREDYSPHYESTCDYHCFGAFVRRRRILLRWRRLRRRRRRIDFGPPAGAAPSGLYLVSCRCLDGEWKRRTKGIAMTTLEIKGDQGFVSVLKMDEF